MTINSAHPNTSASDLRLLLSQHAPILPKEELRLFVGAFFARRQEYLDIMDNHPSPLYVIEEEVLKRRSMQFQAAFRNHIANVSFYFAVKSNNHPDIARILLQTGVGLDVSSGLELDMALGLDAPDIVFSGPGKTKAELQQAVQASDRLTVLVDSFNELAQLGEIAAAKNKQVRVGVRLSANMHGLWRKFGIPPEELGSFMEKIGHYPQLQFQGIQFHSSWNLTPKKQVEFIHSLGKTLGQFPKQALAQVRFIDIGGGFWIPQGEWLQEATTEAGILRKALGISPGKNKKHYRLPALPLETFAQQIGSAINNHILPILPGCRIYCEPGRWLCNDSMHILLTVVDKKRPDLVITDGGTNAVGWERFESDYFPVLNLSRPALYEQSCDILGSLCTPHDVWGYNYFGEDIRIGDVLMIPTQGAYTYSLRQNFIKPLPEVVILA
jgi:diaminopimelate decarboxylase